MIFFVMSEYANNRSRKMSNIRLLINNSYLHYDIHMFQETSITLKYNRETEGSITH